MIYLVTIIAAFTGSLLGSYLFSKKEIITEKSQEVLQVKKKGAIFQKPTKEQEEINKVLSEINQL